MAIGDLSTDQARFLQRVAAGTGLDPHVVTSWIGTESGWNTYKASHNYLNIGPGRTYASTDVAADATVDLIRSSGLYPGIVASAAQGPGAQIEAIGRSRWGTKLDTLSDVFADLTGVHVVSSAGTSRLDFTIPAWANPGKGDGPTIPLPSFGDAKDAAGNLIPDVPSVGDVYGSVAGDVGKVATAVTTQVLQGALALVFSSAAIGLIGLGVFKLTAKPAAKAVHDVGDTVDKVTTAAALIPSPATKGAALATTAAKAL